MKKTLFLWMLMLMVLAGAAQDRPYLQGVCVNEKDRPIENVSVYLNDSLLVSVTDENGHFALLRPLEGQELRFAHLVYEPTRYTLEQQDLIGKELKIEMKTRDYELMEVEIAGNAPQIAFDNPVRSVIFKIAPNTNGSTDPTDPTAQGLYPITFDAVVVDIEDDKTQETITTFEDYSITTYVNGSDVTTDNEYKKGKDIYVVKTNNTSAGAVVAPTAIGLAAGNAEVYTATTSTSNPINEATIKAQLNGSPLGITLTVASPAATRVSDGKVPAADGTNYEFGNNGAVKFTPSAAGTYVYVFTRTVNVPAQYSTAASATFDVSTTYYFKNTVGSTDVYYPAAGINADNFAANKANLYTQDSAGTPGEYDVKVIKVVD